MFNICSPDFRDGEKIPRTFTQEGENISPRLEWWDVPEEAEEMVLICEDPDAPQEEPYVHWLLYGLSPSVTGLPDGLPAQGEIREPFHCRQGRNSDGKLGYVGPMPPLGHGWHHYKFHLYALKRRLDLRPGLDVKRLREAILPHLIADVEIMGRYRRDRRPLRSEERHP
ncbi:MAG: YbhB/YbcL family Raf kinase inhibitor-like protein [Bdellovibrionaceae bacterium]|nr:YbhB/YbcL family Raf kinase inhibitor-like protein [Pseudobdellovibrionaceae bacterium]